MYHDLKVDIFTIILNGLLLAELILTSTQMTEGMLWLRTISFSESFDYVDNVEALKDLCIKCDTLGFIRLSVQNLLRQLHISFMSWTLCVSKSLTSRASMRCSPLEMLGMWIVVLKVSNMPISCRTSFRLVVPRISNLRPCSVNTTKHVKWFCVQFMVKLFNTEGQNFSLKNFRDVLLQPCYGAYLREVKRWAIPRGPSEQRGLWVALLWRPVYASACRWGATQAAGLPGLGSLTNPFYQLTQDPTPCWVLLYTVLIWRNRPSAIQNTLQTQHNTYSCLHTHSLPPGRQTQQ